MNQSRNTWTSLVNWRPAHVELLSDLLRPLVLLRHLLGHLVQHRHDQFDDL
jgi:hypothetical protein